MLPPPVSSVPKYKAFRRVTSPQKRVLDALLSRSRATNLAFFLLAFLCGISLLYNVRFYARHSFREGSAMFATISRPNALADLDHLVVVPCHAIWQGGDPSSRLNEEDWILEPYQKGGNRVAAFFNHIEKGVELARQDIRSLLVFSGGQTRLSSSTTEAESYMRLAMGTELLHASNSDPVFRRVTTENYALDSYQNLLFSLARFREFTGHFPERITVIGYEFKRMRFTQLHRVAIRWPEAKFRYIGVDPDEHSPSTEQGERRNGYLPYSLDKYGCHSVLLSKRLQRNPHSRFHPYYVTSPELVPLFDWCPSASEGSLGESTLFNEALPWDHFFIG
ncbi:hypothetical protein K443DRAFT_83349 [Laccaria amethystina LaAM-08-1]|uniref:DUF218 domain-containing protein n=1 Tax=Laccaria amethystina LaAM-08-1 TaxID=1095629 RepID=A0A0C9YMV0_9AGAR|nr:hypothetical protein K443DRAFT_83349 [Laccaria amethystina LaAM-08-1]